MVAVMHPIGLQPDPEWLSHPATLALKAEVVALTARLHEVEGAQEDAQCRLGKAQRVNVAHQRDRVQAERAHSIVDVAGDLICETHPTLEWPHDDCPGPGMPMRNALSLLARAEQRLVLYESEMAKAADQIREDDAALDQAEQRVVALERKIVLIADMYRRGDVGGLDAALSPAPKEEVQGG